MESGQRGDLPYRLRKLRHAARVHLYLWLKHRPDPEAEVRRTYWHATTVDQKLPAGELGDDGRRVERAEANLVSSLCESGMHAPVIDIDHPARLVPSQTPGHSHLYIDVEMPWWRYRLLLAGLMLSGVVGAGHNAHARRRRMTMVRLPRDEPRP